MKMDCRRIVIGWIGYCAATSHGSILVMLVILLRCRTRHGPKLENY
nr:hypothetical protein Iba_chr02bCG20510 [Ipomoea batatas]GMC63524.1 hypothetical protein Iba_chr02cCG14110 [Ipomoea batatas]